MKILKLFLSILCFFGVFIPKIVFAATCASNQIEVNNNCIDSKFTVTTKSLSKNTTFKFVLSATGTFYVDWGDGNVDLITRNDTSPTEYGHLYSTAGIKTIRFAGLATGYNTTNYQGEKDSSGAAIRFGATSNNISTSTGGTPTLITQLSGSIGSVFPTLGSADNEKPTFFDLCAGCTALTQVSDTLFSGVTSAKKNLFRSVFDKCSKLTSVPGNLFSGVSGSAESMFRSAFYECTSLSSLPANLFSGINGAATKMFMYTFYKNTGLSGQYIPPTLFTGLHGQQATDLFASTFASSGLVGTCPSGTVQFITGYENQWNGKVSCEIEQVVSCTGLTYKDGNSCVSCPTGYNYNTQDGKTSISDCQISCPAGTWTGEYERLDYIEGTGTQYIDTGHAISSTTFSADFEISSGQNVSGNIGHFGGNQDASNGHAANFKDSKFGLWVVYIQGNTAGTKVTTGGSFNANVRKHVRYDFVGNQRTLTVDGTSKSDTFNGSIISNNTYRLFSNGCVGGCNDKLLEGRIHWFKVYENNALIFDFIPVRRVSDNEIGMYDLVNGRFFGNSGTGTFGAGAVSETIGGSVCENVGIGYWSVASVTGYGSISQRNACSVGQITLTDTSTSASDCHSASGYTVCPVGTYIPANSQTCTTCTAGNWCPGGQLYFESTDQGLYSCVTEIDSGWSSAAGSSAQTDCYYLITLDKNGYSGALDAYSGVGCHVVSTATSTANAQLKLFYNTECTLPALNFSATGAYASATSWSTSNTVNENTVTTIAPITATPVVTTYYARKSCAANRYKTGVSTCSACGVNSSTPNANVLTTCTCDTGYTADGTVNGNNYSTTGCISVASGVTHLHVEDKLYSLLSQRRTTPSICVDVANTIYYVSLVPAEIENALAVEYNNMTYSGCDITNDYCIANGKLYWADPDLYLKSSGTQYINTGIVPDLDTAIEIEMADTTSNTYGLFGLKTGTLSTTDEGFGISLSGGKFGFFRNGTSTDAITKDNNYHVYYLSNTTASIDGTVYNFAPASSPVGGNQPMYMFGFNHNGFAYDKTLNVKYLKIWSGNTLLRHFVPVPTGLVIGNYTVPENGMFDIVTQTFYANPGVGNFQYGKVE